MFPTEGVEFDMYLYDCLYFYAKSFSIIQKKRLKEVYGSHITNINFMIMIQENIFLINSSNLNNIINFITECEFLKTKLKKSYRFHLIYLTRIMSVPYSSVVNLYLYDYSMQNNYSKEYEYILMKLYNYIVHVTGIRLGLKEYLSNDILMTYEI